MGGKRRGWALGAVLSCCVAAATPALAGGTESHRTDPENRHAAVRDALRLLQRVRLPAGAAASSQEPAGDGGVLGEPSFREGLEKLINRHAWWTVNRSPGQVFNYIVSHAPSGGTENTSCRGGSQPSWRCVGYQFPPRAGVLGVRELVLKVVGLKDGGTGIRADAEVQWIIVRPASERVPSGVGEIVVTRNRRHSGEAVAVGDPSTIHRIIRLFEALPVLQPGSWTCPAIPSGAAMDSFSFQPPSGGRALARAAVRANVGWSETGCDAMSFWIGPRRQMSLVGARRFLLKMGHLLGVRLTERPRS